MYNIREHQIDRHRPMLYHRSKETRRNVCYNLMNNKDTIKEDIFSLGLNKFLFPLRVL